MNKTIDYKEVLARIGYFRNKVNLSAREASFRLDRGELYVSRIENGKVALKVDTLLKLLEIFGINEKDFFYLGKEYNEEDKNILDLYGSLSSENKKFALEFMRKLK